MSSSRSPARAPRRWAAGGAPAPRAASHAHTAEAVVGRGAHGADHAPPPCPPQGGVLPHPERPGGHWAGLEAPSPLGPGLSGQPGAECLDPSRQQDTPNQQHLAGSVSDSGCQPVSRQESLLPHCTWWVWVPVLVPQALPMRGGQGLGCPRALPDTSHRPGSWPRAASLDPGEGSREPPDLAGSPPSPPLHSPGCTQRNVMRHQRPGGSSSALAVLGGIIHPGSVTGSGTWARALLP